MTTAATRVFALWGAHRRAPSVVGDQPSSIDKGVPELAALGYEIVSIYPQAQYLKLPAPVRTALRGRGLYLLSVLHLLRAIRSDDVIYTTDKAWAGWIARLKKWSVLRNRLVFKWAGFDLDWPALRREQGRAQHRFYQAIITASEVIFNISENEVGRIKSTFNGADTNTLFWPTAVDVPFYRNVAVATEREDSGIVAVGSDHMRDWSMVVALARCGIKVTVVTEDAKARHLIDGLGRARPATLDLAFRVGLRRSAEIMANAQALLISTLPNERFSGATTVGVAAALGKPLILDEAYDLAAYGLIPRINCETFERGQIDSALAAIDRVVSNPAHAARLGENITRIADSLDIRHYAAALSAAFRQDRALGSFDSTAPAAAVPSLG